MKQPTFRRKKPALVRGKGINGDDSSCSSMPSQYSDHGYNTVSSSSSSLLSSSCSSSSFTSLQHTGRVSFHSKVQVRSVKAEFANFDDDQVWYSRDDLQKIKQSAADTVREMRNPVRKKKRGFCSRGLENVKSAEHSKARLHRLSQHFDVILHSSDDKMARAAAQDSQTCRQLALDLASKDEVFVRTTLNLDELMETVQREQQACRDDRTMRPLRLTATLHAPVWEKLNDSNDNAASSTASPIISSLISSKAKQWVSSAMVRSRQSWRQKQQQQQQEQQQSKNGKTVAE